MSIADKITRLQNAKEDIADAITNAGGTVAEGDGFEEFSSDIGTISSGITVNESYDISEGTLNGATITLEGDVVAHIPDGVVTISNTAFKKNGTITKVIMADSVENIENGSYGSYGAFYECSKLKNVEFSNHLTSIGSFAFFHCTSLTSITIPDSVTTISDSTFSGCTSLTSITIPDSVTTISDGTFSGCTSLTSITIPDSVTSIGNSAFSSCNALTSLTLGNSVTSIRNNAFQYCGALTTLTIPNSVTSIGNSAFYNCNSLTTVDMTAFDGTTVPTLADPTAFYAETHAQDFKFLFATQEALNAFASASNWSIYSKYFEVAQASE